MRRVDKGKGFAMNWVLWSALFVGVLVLLAVGLPLLGEKRWADLMRTHLGQLDSARADDARQPLSPPMAPQRYVTNQLEGLPVPVQRYFRLVLRDGHPLIRAATIDMQGSINMSATGEQWKPFTSTQRAVNRASGLRPGFHWNAAVTMFPGVPARVEDSYIAGQGQLIAKLYGLFSVAQAQGDGEMARGEFMRYFAEAAWYPTALLPSQGVRWQAVDDASAQAAIVDSPITLTLLFRFNEAGLIDSVRAEARGAGVGKDAVMLPWDCSYANYQPQHGMLIPMTGEAAWIKPEGRKPYFVGKVKKLSYEYSK
jgi:hypothetical protein